MKQRAGMVLEAVSNTLSERVFTLSVGEKVVEIGKSHVSLLAVDQVTQHACSGVIEMKIQAKDRQFVIRLINPEEFLQKNEKLNIEKNEDSEPVFYKLTVVDGKVGAKMYERVGQEVWIWKACPLWPYIKLI